MLARSVTNDEYLVNYKAFLDEYGGKNAYARSMVYKVKRKGKHEKSRKHELPKAPSEHAPSREMAAHHEDKLNAFYVFIAGFLICPIWCVGWAWINSKFPVAKVALPSDDLMSLFQTL